MASEYEQFLSQIADLYVALANENVPLDLLQRLSIKADKMPHFENLEHTNDLFNISDPNLKPLSSLYMHSPFIKDIEEAICEKL